MTESEFNKERDRLIHKMTYGSCLERMTAYDEFVKFMETKSKNSHWNTKYTCLYVGEKLAKHLKKLNLGWEESNMCKFNNCEYYNYDTQECCLGICKNLEN